MATPNPVIKARIDELKKQLADVRAEKTRLFPPNRDPLGTPDKFPRDYTPEQIAYHRQLNARIEQLEAEIEELQNRLYVK